MLQERSEASSLLTGWRAILDDRTQQSIRALTQISGVLGLILAGSVGRNETWPLSDIDLLVIYEDDAAEQAAQAVEGAQAALLDWWAAEAYGGTSLDVGKLRFTRHEVLEALSHPPRDAARYMDNPRWFHSLDKGYRSRAVFDPAGIATTLSSWITDARFIEDVVWARQQVRLQQMERRIEAADRALAAGDHSAALCAVREGVHTLISALMEAWGVRDNSAARLGTRFERAAAARGEQNLAGLVFRLAGLTPDAVTRAIAVAPAGIRYRHQVSLAARRLVGEAVTAEQDARDVLLIFRLMHIRGNRPPDEPWIGLETCETTLAGHIEAFRHLLTPLAQPRPKAGAHMRQQS